jgi:hypothetical protein
MMPVVRDYIHHLLSDNVTGNTEHNDLCVSISFEHLISIFYRNPRNNFNKSSQEAEAGRIQKVTRVQKRTERAP